MSTKLYHPDEPKNVITVNDEQADLYIKSGWREKTATSDKDDK